MDIGIESLDVSHQAQDQSNKVRTKEARKLILNKFCETFTKSISWKLISKRWTFLTSFNERLNGKRNDRKDTLW